MQWLTAIGSVAEQSIADSLEQQYELLPEIVRRWAAFRASLPTAQPGALQHPAGLLSRPPLLESLSSDARAELQVRLVRAHHSQVQLLCTMPLLGSECVGTARLQAACLRCKL